MIHISFQLQPGASIFLIWAYHSTSDVQPGQFAFHSTRGFQQVTLIPAATLTPTTNPATTPTRGGFLNHPQPHWLRLPWISSIFYWQLKSLVQCLSFLWKFSYGKHVHLREAENFNLFLIAPVDFVNSVSFNNGNYNVSWMFNSSTDTLHFMVQVRTTGWIGFGVAQTPFNMLGYDVVVGGVSNGSGYLKVNDYKNLLWCKTGWCFVGSPIRSFYQSFTKSRIDSDRPHDLRIILRGCTVKWNSSDNVRATIFQNKNLSNYRL